MSRLDLLKTPSTSRSIQRSSSIPFELFLLMQKVDQLNSSVQVDLTKNIFHLMGKESGKSNPLEDPITKLKNIQNRSQMNRAAVELIAQRRPKRYSLRSQRYSEENHSRDSYLSIYKQMKQQQQIFKEVLQTEHNSEDESSEVNDKGPMGIRHYKFLREHPKILNFALEKLKDKNIEYIQKVKKEEEQSKIKQGSRIEGLELNEEYKDMFDTKRKSRIDILNNPKAIVENQITKFYSKNSKGRIDIKIRENPRCNSILMRQDRIMSMAQEKHVSKENIKKLKQKLNQIVNEMNKDDRRSREFLPKIVPSSHEK